MTENIIVYSPKLEEKLKKEMGEDATSELLNLVRGAVVAHEHAFTKYGITKEDYMKWVSDAWDAGIYQRKIYEGEEEGPVNNAMGVAMNFAGYLAIFGERKGYTNQTKTSQNQQEKGL